MVEFKVGFEPPSKLPQKEIAHLRYPPLPEGAYTFIIISTAPQRNKNLGIKSSIYKSLQLSKCNLLDPTICSNDNSNFIHLAQDHNDFR